MISTIPDKMPKKPATKSTMLNRPRKAADTAPDLRNGKPDYIYHQAFARPDAEQAIWGSDSPEIDVACYTLMPAVEGERAPSLARPPRLSADQEKTLFLRYNYAKYRLAHLLGSKNQGRSSRIRREADQWRQRALATREKLVHANLALVPSMAKRMRDSDLEFGDLVSEGHLAILRSVEKFDVSRGFKFSTYACRAIIACFRRMASKARTNTARFPVTFTPEMEHSDFDERCHEEQRQDAIDMVRDVLQRNTAKLNEMECRIIHERFSMAADGKRRTLGQISQSVGLSVERVRQIIKEALAKIREAMAVQFAA
jgi:RNA polymerase sigma factor (sigma-70 family)